MYYLKIGKLTNLAAYSLNKLKVFAPAKTLKKLSPTNSLKMKAHFDMILTASPFLPWRLKVESK